MKLLLFCAIGLLYLALPSVSSARFMCYFPNWSGYRTGNYFFKKRKACCADAVL